MFVLTTEGVCVVSEVRPETKPEVREQLDQIASAGPDGVTMGDIHAAASELVSLVNGFENKIDEQYKELKIEVKDFRVALKGIA